MPRSEEQCGIFVRTLGYDQKRTALVYAKRGSLNQEAVP
jgi:hypothetical protein